MSEEIKFGLFVGQQAREWDPDRLPWKDDSLVALAFKDNKVVARAGIIASEAVRLPLSPMEPATRAVLVKALAGLGK